MTVGLLKEIWKEHNVTDDDIIDFHFTSTDEYKECREMEFNKIYKREFGILMDFIPTELTELNEGDDYDL